MRARTDVKISGCSESLHDLERVGLEIEAVPRALQDAGLARQDILGFVRKRLDLAPVQVLSRTGALHLKGAPTLFLEVLLSERQTGSYVFLVGLELVQGVNLERLSDSHRFFAAPTWRAQTVGLLERAQVRSLLDHIGAVAEAFATAGDAR